MAVMDTTMTLQSLDSIAGALIAALARDVKLVQSHRREAGGRLCAPMLDVADPLRGQTDKRTQAGQGPAPILKSAHDV